MTASGAVPGPATAGGGTARPVAPYVYRATASPREAATWSRRYELATNLRTIMGRAYPRVIGALREPSWVLFEVLLPFLTTSAFVFVYRSLRAPEEFIGFVVLGGAMTAFWLNVMWLMAAQLYWDKEEGNLPLYLTTPINLMSVMLGMAAGGMAMTTSRALAVLAIGTWLYGVSYRVENWPLLALVFVLTLAALYGLGMMLSSIFVMWGRQADHLTRLAEEPVYFISGLNFPVGRLGFLGGLAIATIPLAVGLDAMRQLAFSGGVGSFGTPSPAYEALILAAMTLLFLVLARVFLAAIIRMARHEGKLTSRGE
jgi:ABC-2 type transport system permease protein